MSEEFDRLGGWPGLLARLFRREDLATNEVDAAFAEILDGEALPTQIAAFAAALRTKGETVEELCGLVEAIRARGERVVAPGGAVDTCGTGGDRSGTVNVSTAAAFVLAAGGVPVCKHGGRAASSQAGSADVLEALGVTIELGPSGVERCLAEVGFGFCFAPRYHPAMRHAVPVRRELGAPTVFNFLGPLVNPSGLRRQVVGVGDPTMAERMLTVLERTGAEHVIVCYGHDGLDELSTVTTSALFEAVRQPDGSYIRSSATVDPRALGLAPASPAALQGGDPSHNAGRLRAILAGEDGPQRDLVALNAGAGFIVAGRAETLADGLELSQSILDSGEAVAVVDSLVTVSNKAAAEAQ